MMICSPRKHPGISLELVTSNTPAHWPVPQEASRLLTTDSSDPHYTFSCAAVLHLARSGWPLSAWITRLIWHGESPSRVPTSATATSMSSGCRLLCGVGMLPRIRSRHLCNFPDVAPLLALAHNSTASRTKREPASTRPKTGLQPGVPWTCRCNKQSLGWATIF